MSRDKRNALVIVLTLVITSLVYRLIEGRTGTSGYNPFTEGLDGRIVVIFGSYAVITLAVYFVLSRFIFKENRKKQD